MQAKIAQELDAMERQFMQEGGLANEDYLKFINEESGNVDNSGMFSIQVIADPHNVTMKLFKVVFTVLKSRDGTCNGG